MERPSKKARSVTFSGGSAATASTTTSAGGGGGSGGAAAASAAASAGGGGGGGGGGAPRDRGSEVLDARAARAALRRGVQGLDDDGGGAGGAAPPPAEFDGDVPLEAFAVDGDEEEGHFDPETGTFVFAAREAAFARRAARRSGLRATEDEEEGEAEGGGGRGGGGGGDDDDDDEEDGEGGGAGGGAGDAWMADLTAMAPGARRAMQEAARAQQAAREAAAAASGGGGGGGGEAAAGDAPPLRRALALHALAQRLQEGEDVAGALRRLSGGGGGGGAWRRKRAGGGEGAAAAGAAAAAAAGGRDMAAFDAVTEASDALLRDGLASVFSLNKRRAALEVSEALADVGMTRAAFEALLAARGLSAPPPPPPPPPPAPPRLLPPGREFVLRWASDASGALHGPFQSAEMDAWAAAGYFAAQPAEVARKGPAGLGAWGPLAAQYEAP
jgi:hypothetical protein